LERCQSAVICRLHLRRSFSYPIITMAVYCHSASTDGQALIRTKNAYFWRAGVRTPSSAATSVINKGVVVEFSASIVCQSMTSHAAVINSTSRRALRVPISRRRVTSLITRSAIDWLKGGGEGGAPACCGFAEFRAPTREFKSREVAQRQKKQCN